MNQFPLISIIIPVFNVEHYLYKCIDSILNQNYHNIEILLINDGSTDNSGDICDEYSNKDNRIKVFHQENRGVSSARNKGIKNAEGFWLCFVDADDWIEEKSLENIISSLNRNCTLDMVISKSYINNGDSLSEEKYPFKKEWTLKCYNGITLYVEYEYMRGSVWGVLFRKDFINKYDISFPLNLSNGEDTIFIILCNIYAKCVYFVDIHFYNVFEREGSASRNWTFERTMNMVNNIGWLNYYLKANNDLSLEAKSLLNHGKLAVVTKVYSKFYRVCSLRGYVELRKKIKSKLNDKIQIGNIKSGRLHTKLLNISPDLYALYTFAKKMIKNDKYDL